MLKHISWSPRQLEQILLVYYYLRQTSLFSGMLFQSQLPHRGSVGCRSSYPVTLRLDPLPADMLSCCCFCSGKFQSLRTEHLSSPLLLSLLPSESSFPVFFCSFCFIPLLLQISPLITEVDVPSQEFQANCLKQIVDDARRTTDTGQWQLLTLSHGPGELNIRSSNCFFELVQRHLCVCVNHAISITMILIENFWNKAY